MSFPLIHHRQNRNKIVLQDHFSRLFTAVQWCTLEALICISSVNVSWGQQDWKSGFCTWQGKRGLSLLHNEHASCRTEAAWQPMV